MKENVFDVLLYMFENYMYDEPEESSDRDSLQVKLLEAGFPHQEIDKAFQWMDDLAAQRPVAEPRRPHSAPLRVFSDRERTKLDSQCQGYLLFLEDSGILTPGNRELVIDRFMALEDEEAELDTLKWVVLMVLFNQPGQEAAFAWMENLVFDDQQESLH